MPRRWSEPHPKRRAESARLIGEAAVAAVLRHGRKGPDHAAMVGQVATPQHYFVAMLLVDQAETAAQALLRVGRQFGRRVVNELHRAAVVVLNAQVAAESVAEVLREGGSDKR